jgi:dTDP-4-amino-4,6-dideoxygalactose transaminase
MDQSEGHMSVATRVFKSPPLRLAFSGEPLPFPFDSHNTHLTYSGRFAIREGLRALGLAPSATVLLPEWHCGSELDAVLAAGHRVALYRLHADLSADLEDLERQVKATKAAAIYVIHYFGFSQPIEHIQPLARNHGALLIEDLALGLFSTNCDGIPLGQQGDMSVFSLVKTLPLPDGGALWLKTHRPKALDRLKRASLRKTLAGSKGLLRRSFNPFFNPTLNGRSSINPLSAESWDSRAGIDAMDRSGRPSLATRVLVRMTHASKIIQRHRRNFERLHAHTKGGRKLRPLMPDLPKGACPAFFPLFTSELPALHAHLLRAGIQSVPFWRSCHPAVDLKTYARAIELRRSVLRLPIHAGVTPEHMEHICATLSKF